MRAVFFAVAVALLSGCPGDPSCPNDLPATCPADAPGYAATIEPLMSRRCLPCHAAGSWTGTDLATYDEVSKKSGVVLTQVYGCLMPQSDAGQLTSDERKQLLGWLKCGAQNN